MFFSITLEFNPFKHRIEHDLFGRNKKFVLSNDLGNFIQAQSEKFFRFGHVGEKLFDKLLANFACTPLGLRHG